MSQFNIKDDATQPDLSVADIERSNSSYDELIHLIDRDCHEFKPNDTFDVQFVPTEHSMKYVCKFTKGPVTLVPVWEDHMFYIVCECPSCLKLDLADRKFIPFYAMHHDGITFIKTDYSELHNID